MTADRLSAQISAISALEAFESGTYLLDVGHGALCSLSEVKPCTHEPWRSDQLS